MKFKRLFWLRLFIAVVCFIISIFSFFISTNLLPLVFTLMSVLFILNGWEISKFRNQPKEMGYLYTGVGSFILILTFIKALLS